MTTNAREADPSSVAVLVSMPLPCNGAGVSYTCTSITRNIDRPGLGIRIFTPYGHVGVKSETPLTETLPSTLRWLPFPYVRGFVQRLHEASYLKAVRRAAKNGKVIAYVWPDPSLKLVKEIRASGAIIVRESVNCHQATGRKILDAEYRRIGLAPQHLLTEASVELERQLFEYCDTVFCSNAFAEQSLLENGVPAAKIRGVSFGWDRDRFQGDSKALPDIDGTTFIFVGYICVRKGAHLLLQYWARSGIRGRLVLIGRLEPAIQSLCGQYLARADVQVVQYTRDLGPYYRSADAFVFPSLEEGGPQVTYEAAGCRLPLITSAMGAARVAAHKSTGFIVDPFDEAGWIDAMRTIAYDQDLRRRMGQAAYQRALQFTWRKVSEDRSSVFQTVAASDRGRLSDLTAQWAYAARRQAP